MGNEEAAIDCTPRGEEEWMQLSPGGTPEVDAKLVHANPCWFRLVDVREADELDDGLGAIDGVEHVPQREVVAEISGWSSEQPVVLVCRSGRRGVLGRSAWT